jgi:hypothetical protein
MEVSKCKASGVVLLSISWCSPQCLIFSLHYWMRASAPILIYKPDFVCLTMTWNPGMTDEAEDEATMAWIRTLGLVRSSHWSQITTKAGWYQQPALLYRLQLLSSLLDFLPNITIDRISYTDLCLITMSWKINGCRYDRMTKLTLAIGRKRC